jgi:excisionase family DNA binding protein
MDTKPPLTVKQAAERLGIAQATLRQWMSERRIAWIKLGPSPKAGVRIPAEEIERILRDGYVPTIREERALESLPGGLVQ